MAVITKSDKWLKRSFMMATEGVDDKRLVEEALFTEVIARPFDTSPGGAEVLNPLPQFTRHCDIKRQPNFFNNTTLGVGRYHDETFGLTQQKIYLSFGIPKFNNMNQFFTGFYNAQAGILANTGRTNPGMAYWFGRAAGSLIVLNIVLYNPIMLAAAIGIPLVRFLTGHTGSKYYYFDQAMRLYWNTVTTMVNHYAVERGIIPRVWTSDVNQKANQFNNYTQEELKKMSEVLEIIDETGHIDIYRYATLSHRRKRLYMKRLESLLSGKDKKITFDAVSSKFRQMVRSGDIGAVGPYGDLGLDGTWKKYQDTFLSKEDKYAPSSTDNTATTPPETQGVQKANVDSTLINMAPELPLADDYTVDDDYTIKYSNAATGDVQKQISEEQGFAKLTSAELDDGALFICLRVNSTGEVSESFSNSTTQSDIAGTINSTSSSARSAMFNISGGNITGAIGTVVETAKNFAAGVTDSFGISGLAVLGGAAFVDIPDRWESSSASLPSQSYTMSLVSPYGNPLSQLFNMYIPLFCILAGALPRSTGKQSYTSPFLCQLFDKGKQQTRLGIIDSISVRRGTTNLPFNKHMQAMGIEVTFTVKDLSSIMHIPIAENFSLNPFRGTFDEHTVFTDYMNILAGVDLDDNIYMTKLLRGNITRKIANFKSWISPSHMASFVANGTPLSLVKMFYRGVDT